MTMLWKGRWVTVDEATKDPEYKEYQQRIAKELFRPIGNPVNRRFPTKKQKKAVIQYN